MCNSRGYVQQVGLHATVGDMYNSMGFVQW